MKKSLLVTLILVACSTTALAHSGRTDSNGGHNCSQKSVNKGLCSGYHYHSGSRYMNDADGHEGHFDQISNHHHDEKSDHESNHKNEQLNKSSKQPIEV